MFGQPGQPFSVGLLLPRHRGQRDGRGNGKRDAGVPQVRQDHGDGLRPDWQHGLKDGLAGDQHHRQ